MTAMLVELGFITNTIDNKLFDVNFDGYAEAIAKGICTALGITYIAEDLTEAEVLYRVQVGAFRAEENARAFLQQVREMGLEAFLVTQETAKGE